MNIDIENIKSFVSIMVFHKILPHITYYYDYRRYYYPRDNENEIKIVEKIVANLLTMGFKFEDPTQLCSTILTENILNVMFPEWKSNSILYITVIKSLLLKLKISNKETINEFFEIMFIQELRGEIPISVVSDFHNRVEIKVTIISHLFGEINFLLFINSLHVFWHKRYTERISSVLPTQLGCTITFAKHKMFKRILTFL